MSSSNNILQKKDNLVTSTEDGHIPEVSNYDFIEVSSFPKTQLAILCLLRTLDPMSFTQIFPYINQFISDLGITNDPAQVGFYSGLVDSSFAFTQLLSTYPWGRFSDRFGRRPVVLVTVLGLAITTLLFGFSRSLTTAILMRGAAGLFAGNVSVLPTMLCEITDKTTQAFAFSLFGFWWPLGTIIGSLIGGLLSKPATRYPNYLNYELFREHPYLLPCLIVSFIAATIFLVSWFFLQETLDAENKRYIKPSAPSYGATETSKLSKDHSLRESLSVPIIRAICISAFFLSVMSNSFDVLFVLFCFSPINMGGLSFSTSQIGFALSASGVIAAVLQIFFMPTILRRVSPVSMYHFSMKVWPYTFLAMPLLNIVASQRTMAGTGKMDFPTIVILWVLIVVVLIMARVAFLAYTVNVLLVKQVASSSSSLGSTLGLVQFFICLARAVSPIFARWAILQLPFPLTLNQRMLGSSAFAFAVRHQILGGHVWAIVMALIGFTSCLCSRNVVRESSKLV